MGWNAEESYYLVAGRPAVKGKRAFRCSEHLAWWGDCTTFEQIFQVRGTDKWAKNNGTAIKNCTK